MKKLLIALVIVFLLLGVFGRLAAVAAAATPAGSHITANNSGWVKKFKTIRAARGCIWHTRVALCKTVRVYVHRYGYVNHGLIYNSGQTLSIVWRYFRGTRAAHYCLKCLLQVRATNYQATLPYDPTWDWDSMITSDAWGSCSVGEHLFGHGCKSTYRQHVNRFINYYVFDPIPLTRTESAGVTTDVSINTTGRNNGLTIHTKAACC